MRLKTCFGCCSLRSGAIVIGSVSLAWSILSAISAGPHLIDIEENATRHNEPYVKMFLVGVLTYMLVIGAMAGLMIYGAQKSNPEYVFPWLALATTNLLVFISLTFSFIVIGPTVLTIEWFFINLAVISTLVALHVYVWLIVFSFYKHLVAEKYSKPAPSNDEKVLNQPMNIYHKV